ncbi:MAG: hypothetical protein MI754_12885 [Chromatiales bacterium]|nr:hypothetical protein [Chromatiales bacterium]
MSKRAVRSIALIVGSVVCSAAAAMPAQLPQNMMSGYHLPQPGYIQAAPNVYRYRPVQYRPAQYQPVQRAPWQPAPFGYRGQRYLPPPQPVARGYTNRVPTYPATRVVRPTAAFPMQPQRLVAPGYQGRYQYPAPGYTWRPPVFNRYPVATRPQAPAYSGYRYPLPTQAYPRYVPQPRMAYTPYQMPPIRYGSNSGAAYLLPNVRPAPVNQFAHGAPGYGYLPPVTPAYNPYSYAPGQGLMARSGRPAPVMRAPLGRYLPSYEGMKQRIMNNNSASLYRFRPDPKFTQQPPMPMQPQVAPAPAGQHYSYRPTQLNPGEGKLVWRPMEKLAKHNPY